MTRLRRRLILSIVMLALTVITVTSATYAWFANNQNAWVDDFELEIDNQDGMLISVDGVNFYASISNEELIKAIISKKTNVPINELEISKLKEQFEGIRLSSVTTKDLINYYTIDQSNVVDNYYQLKHADNNSYIEFDLYFRILTDVGSEVQSLSFASDSYVKSDAKAISLVNELKSKGITYKSGNAIAINPADAVRVGILVSDNNSSIIYEPNVGLGSYAIEGEDVVDEDYDINYDPSENAMFTYFNNMNEIKLAPLSMDDSELYKGTKTFNDNTIISSFGLKEDNTGYKDIKVTVSVWLEGYDADYFVGIDIKSLKMYLNFKKEGIANE